MGVIRISDKLHAEIQEWLDLNGNEYTHPGITAFANKALYEWLKKLKANKNG